jgi:splicing factor U2AF subunit
MNGLNGRFYAGKVIMAEFSPVTDFKDAKCRQYKEGACDRKFKASFIIYFIGGGYCNFLHPKHVNRELKK